MKAMNDDTLVFDGKKFISSRRASKAFGYSIDYLGQLARAKKIESQMVGRTRFVGEASLIEYIHQTNNDPQVPQVRTNKEISSQRGQSVDDIFHNKVPKKDNKEYKLVVASTLAGLILAGLYFSNVLPVDAGWQAFRDSSREIVALFREDDADKSFVALTRESDGRVFKDKLDSIDNVVLPYFEKADTGLARFGNKIRAAILGWFGKANVLTKSDSSRDVTTEVVLQQQINTPVANSDTPVIPAGLSEEEIRAVVREIMLSERDVFAPGGPLGGLVTLQSTGNPVKDAQTIDYIKKSFSDEVTVSFDQTGRSGLVKPIFRNTGDTDPYIFVLVPINQ